MRKTSKKIIYCFMEVFVEGAMAMILEDDEVVMGGVGGRRDYAVCCIETVNVLMTHVGHLEGGGRGGRERGIHRGEREGRGGGREEGKRSCIEKTYSSLQSTCVHVYMLA